MVGRHSARRLFDAEGFPDDEVSAGFRIAAHNLRVVGIGGLVGIEINDVATIPGGDERLVDGG